MLCVTCSPLELFSYFILHIVFVFATKDQKAVTVAKVLAKKFFCHDGLPTRIHSNQDHDFESWVIHEMLGICKSWTAPYHTQGDPQPEWFNQTLLSMLGTLKSIHKQHWNHYMSQAVHAYNSTKSDATGYSPYLLVFGREARLPVDVCLGTGRKEEVS